MQLLRGRQVGIEELAISPDGRFLVAGASNCHVWDLHESKPKPRVVQAGGPRNYGLNVQFVAPTKLFLRAANPPGWYRQDVETGHTTDLMRPPSLPWDTACLDPTGVLLKVFSRHGSDRTELISFRVLDDGVEPFDSGKPTTNIQGLSAFGFSPCGGSYLVFADMTGEPAWRHHLLDRATDAVVATFERPPGGRTTNAGTWCFSPDGRRLYVAAARRLMCYDCATGGLPAALATLSRHEFAGNPPLAAHPDGRLLAVVEDGRAVTFRDADTLEVLRTYDFAMPTVTCVAFTPDGTRCVLGNSRGKVLLFDVD